ncbi:MAG: bifunctional oligoribonuclease/PAP phosphatase NrnA [Crocinitomicaceae bacterium]
MIIKRDKIKQLQSLISAAKKIVITAHKGPDGDSVGSSLGLYHYLTQLHPEVVICHPDEAPFFLHWMEGYKHILNLESHENQVTEAFETADLIFCLDYNSPSRIGKMEPLLTSSSAKKVMIDHHRDPDETFCDLMFSDIQACSTSQLVYEIIDASDDLSKVNQLVGTPLYTGIVTDTGSFRFSSTRPKTHRIVAELIDRGVKHWEVHENIFDTNSLARIQLISYAMLEKLQVLEKFQTGYIFLSAEDLKKFAITKGDTEGLVNQILGISGVKVAVFFKEADGLIKISFRSKGNIPINEIAKTHFGGGGHLNASGGKHSGKLEDAVEKFVTILPKFVEEHKALF